MRYQFYVLLISVLFTWPAADSFAQTDAGFFSRDEIPAASLGTVDVYYDPLTGDVLASVGEDIVALIFGVSPFENDPVSSILRTSFDAIDRAALREDAIDAFFFDESPDGLGWLGPLDADSPALPTGVFDLGPIYETLPLPEPVGLSSPLLKIESSNPRDLLTILAELSPEEQLAFEVAAQEYYGGVPTGFSVQILRLDAPAQVVPIQFLRPEFALPTAIPEPFSAVAIPLLGAGCLLRRRRTTIA